MNNLSHNGISVWRVINPSKKAAMNSMGIFDKAMITPSFAPCFNASILLIVPGKSQLFASTRPDVAAITKVESSSVPWIIMVSKLSFNKPWL